MPYPAKTNDPTADTITTFRGQYGFLSNFHPHTILLDGIIYKTSENANHAAKCLNHTDKNAFSDVEPREAKRMAQSVDLRPDWEEVKVGVMDTILRIKFEPRSELASKLARTYPKDIVEVNTWGDRFWGVSKGKGKNHLGKLLMTIRQELMDHEFPPG
ncbi:hypothetical protein HDU67_000847 [Dinochytrium kinnereticum]|nr:hypothetical protein HDU67_000847 [Dinochytrium kinnereticum]